MAPRRNIAVIGLGYVGLPVAVAFARSGASVIGFDIDRARIEELHAGFDRTHEVEKTQLTQPTLVFFSETGMSQNHLFCRRTMTVSPAAGPQSR